MNTEQLVAQLTQDLQPVKPVWVGPRWVVGLLTFSTMVVCGALAFLHLRADLAARFASPSYWLELVLPFFVMAFALVRVSALSIPGRVVNGTRTLWLVMAALIVFELFRGGDFTIGMDISGIQCLGVVMMIALIPGAAAGFLVSKRAPMRLGETGILISVAALAAGFLGIAFHCPIDNSVHISLWHYLLPLMLGSSFGFFGLSRVLKW